MGWVITLFVCIIPFCIQVSGMPSTFVVNRYKRVEDESGPPVVYKTTLISYDKGAQWSILNAPAVDANNQPTLCLPVSIVPDQEIYNTHTV